ncbi:hypothetical protein SMICM17S_06583 [Streptomyces microflavus]
MSRGGGGNGCGQESGQHGEDKQNGPGGSSRRGCGTGVHGRSPWLMRSGTACAIRGGGGRSGHVPPREGRLHQPSAALEEAAEHAPCGVPQVRNPMPTVPEARPRTTLSVSRSGSRRTGRRGTGAHSAFLDCNVDQLFRPRPCQRLSCSASRASALFLHTPPSLAEKRLPSSSAPGGGSPDGSLFSSRWRVRRPGRVRRGRTGGRNRRGVGDETAGDRGPTRRATAVSAVPASCGRWPAFRRLAWTGPWRSGGGPYLLERSRVRVPLWSEALSHSSWRSRLAG